VDHFKDRMLFVQVGEKGHAHPALDGVLDLRGKTSIRQFVRLMHHAQGVLCPVTFAMHLAAAVETRPDAPESRPCVVVAGGREPVHWEAYPHHRFLHTQGALPCCQSGGCWKSRTLPLGDGDSKDNPAHRCIDVVGELPKCMDMITPGKAIEAIESYFVGGVISYLPKRVVSTFDLGAASEHASAARGTGAGAGNPEACRNRVCLRLLGLRRSGVHPVLSWLAGLYEGEVCFLNDINHQPPVQPERPSEDLPGIDGEFNRSVRLDEKKNLLLLGYEDERLVHLRDRPPGEDIYGLSQEFRDVLLLRDPFNTFASRLQLRHKQPNNPFTKDFLLPDKDGAPRLARRWKFLAHEYLGKTNHLNHRKLLINYNRWVADEDYRASLCESLGVPLREEHREIVPYYGFGSSFDEGRYDRRASSMNLSSRWEHFRDDAEFLSLIEDPEIWELSERIFGEVLDHEQLRRSLGHLHLVKAG